MVTKWMCAYECVCVVGGERERETETHYRCTLKDRPMPRNSILNLTCTIIEFQ